MLTIHGFFSYVYRQPKADTVILLVEYRPFDFTGSQIRFVDPATGEVSESRLVKSSNVLSEGREAALAEYEKFRSERKLKKLHPRSFLIELVLDRGIQLAGHRLADTGKFSGRNSIVRNSHLHDGFVRGLLIKAASRIEHNLVERTGAAGILVMPDFYFLENPWPEDVFILRNTFRENNLSINGKRFAAGSGAISILQPQTPGLHPEHQGGGESSGIPLRNRHSRLRRDRRNHLRQPDQGAVYRMGILPGSPGSGEISVRHLSDR